MRVRLGSGVVREELVTSDEVGEQGRGVKKDPDAPQRRRIELPSRQDAERSLRRFAQDKQAMAGYRDLLRSLGRGDMTRRSDDDVIRALSAELWTKSVQLFALPPEPVSGPTNSAAAPPALPLPAKAQPRPKKGPWKLTVTVFTDSKWSWPKAPVTVEVKGSNGSTKSTVMTSNKSDKLEFRGDHDSQLDYEIKASAPGWEPLASQNVLLKNEDDKAREIELGPPKVHLRLYYEDPDEAVHAFPKDFPVTVVFDDASTKDLKVEDDKGYIHFDIEKGKAKFTLKFDHAKVRCLVHPKDAGTVELLEDQTDDQLRKHTTDGKRFFVLPKKWSLVHAKWDADGVAVPQDGKIVIPDAGVATKDKPAKLTLVPKCQYVRLEFHDRKYWKDHSKHRVNIPPVVLKAVRKSGADGTPTDPIAGTHDVVSNWTVERDHAEKTCQAVPWIVVKKDDGTDLEKLNKDMLLEFAWEKGFVHSKSKTERVVLVLEPADDKRKVGKDRAQYYDLPKLWKSKCWWTRFTDKTKNKFFDELSDADIEISLTKATPMAFSLDDIVLVDAAGTSQAVKDADRLGAAKDLSKHSRVALLHLDPEDSFKIKVFDPRPEDAGVYHSKTVFQPDAGAKSRNVLVSYPFNTRAVVFCSGIHDVYDKRTEAADFTKKEVLGARAARLKDADVSVARKFDQGSDVTAGYVHRTRGFDLYYLHYGETDGTTVYSALVTYWSAYIFAQTAKNPGWVDPPDTDPLSLTNDIADTRRYRGHSLARAMTRWNEKDYQFEEADGKTDLVVKSFCLFEAKEVEDPADTWVEVGGVPHCLMAVGTDPDDSWAWENELLMAKDDHDVEADWASDVRTDDYDGTTRPRRVMAHELGHAAIGLWDDYITQKWNRVVPGYKDPQRYPGVPYFRDECSMMRVNRSPRLRMYWGRANWMHDEGKATKTLHKFLAARRFKITWAPAGKTKFGYERDEASRSLYKPTHDEAAYSLGEQGKADMYLYKLGDDEFARQVKGGPYNGILVVEMRLCAAFRNGVTPAVDQWETAKAYAVSDCAEDDTKFYLCKDAHTSGTFATDLGAGRWFELQPDADDYAWGSGTNCAAGEWYSDSGIQYVCVVDHESGSFIAENFVPFGTDHGAWAAGTAYAQGDVVQESGQEYVCVGGHNSAAGFGADAARWLATTGTRHGAWASGTNLVAGDECEESGVTQFCKTDHEAGSIDADVAAKRLVQCPVTKAEWDDASKKDWIVAANRSIEKMLEDTVGKFKLTAASGDFSATYLRIFAQWQTKATPTTADPARTQFTFDVVMGGAAKCFYPAGADMKVGSETDNKTIVRYLFGKVSDDATTRKTQDLTSDLAKADLGKLKAWMESKVGGTYTVGDIT